jgi:hypothetical protein
MDIVILILAMAGAGLLMAGLAGVIWKGERPRGLSGDVAAAVITAIVVGVAEWFVIPAMGLSDTLRLLFVATEPALAALLVLWLIRRSRR